MPSTKKQLLGKWGEDQASLFLTRRGYEIVERNFSVRGGEIDIIAWHKKEHFGKTLCFIEVKTRSSDLGSAERATDFQKLGNIFFVARQYCRKMRIDPEKTPIQFEQVSVYLDRASMKATLKVYVIPVG